VEVEDGLGYIILKIKYQIHISNIKNITRLPFPEEWCARLSGTAEWSGFGEINIINIISNTHIKYKT